MAKITNGNYRKFLDEGIINVIDEEQIKMALTNVQGKHQRQGRALLIALYYTGARPAELLEMKGKDINEKGSYIICHVPGKKGGLPRNIYLRSSKPLVKELYQYAKSTFPEMQIFYKYRNNYVRRYINKKGQPIERTETTGKLGYYFNRWFQGIIEEGISPYYLRHNRFSKLSQAGLSDQQLRILKGSKTIESINPYIHMSSAAAKAAAKKIQ